MGVRGRYTLIDDIADAGDDIYYGDSFTSTSIILNADHSDGTADDWDKNGNLLDDGTYKHTYDAPALDSRLRQREPVSQPETC